MPTIDVTKILPQETIQQLNEQVAAKNAALKAAPVVAPAPAPAPRSLEQDLASAQNAMDNELYRSVAENDLANNTNMVRIAENKAAGALPQAAKTLTPVEQARENVTGLYAKMMEERRSALQKQRTSDIRLAAFNSLGNALRTMVQPLGWAAGGGGFRGATAGVQPYDDRQYLEAFNRAVKANDELANLGSSEAAFQYKLAEDDYKRAVADADYQKRREESNEDYFARLDRQQQIKSGESYQVLVEKRRENAVKAYYTENARRISHKQPPISFLDFINLDGLGNEYYGNWTPSAAEVRRVESGQAANEVAPATEEATAPAETVSATTTATGGTATKKNLTPDEEAIIKKWEKYDTDKSGTISPDEARHGLRLRRPKFDSDEAEAYAKAIAKRDGKKSSGKSNASSTTKKNVTARDIMK